MKSALPEEDPSRTPRRGEEREFLTLHQLAKRAGVAPERVRSWNRRFGYPPATGDPLRYPAEEVAGVLLIAQLTETGLSVGQAIEQALGWRHLKPDVESLGASFDSVPTPVTAYCAGPTGELSVAYVNAASRAAGPLALADPTQARLAKLVLARGGQCERIWIADRIDQRVEHEAMVLTLGPPAFAPGVAVIIEPPHHQALKRTAAEQARLARLERDLTMALRSARRTLQAQPLSQRPLRQVIDHVITAAGATDAITVIGPHGALVCSLSHHGNMHPPRVPGAAQQHLAAAPTWSISWLPEIARQALGITDDHCLVLPLQAGGGHLGYFLLTFEEPLPTAETTGELLMSFAALLASVYALNQTKRPRPRT